MKNPRSHSMEVLNPRRPHAGSVSDRVRLADIARRAMVDRGFEPGFQKEALEELSAISGPAGSSAELRDLRDRPWSSIDNDDSRDLDQLTVAESLVRGRIRIMVAVADVDALVLRDTALDRHAERNTTSVYTPAVIFPMLPERLSTNLTSLNEAQDRVAVIVDMVFEPNGSIASSNLYRGLVKNQAKLAYRSVAAWLEGTGPPPARIQESPELAANLRLQDSVAQWLSEQRHQHGALNLETIQTKTLFDGEAVSNLDVDHKNRAKQLIEDFMIAANGATANYLESKGYPSLRRVLRSPERWDRIEELAAGMGYRLPTEPDPIALQNFLTQRFKADPLRFPDLSLTVIKLMGRGEYALDLPGDEPTGHFGLAVKDYTHSTAPNRRFPDLITQRLLKSAIAGTSLPYTLPELAELANHCTEREDAATKVERQLRKSAAALLMSDRIGEKFDALVVGASPKGTWVRVLEPPLEGRLERGFQGLDVGDHIQVKLIHTDVERGFIDFVQN